MADASAAIRIDIIASGAEAGARRVNAALDGIERRGRSTVAANDNVGGSLERMSRQMAGAERNGGALSRILDDVRGRAAGATPAVGGLVNSLMSMGPLAAIVGGVALGIGAVGAAAIKAAAQTQAWKAQIETITKSTQTAEESYAALVQFGNSTPFDTGQSVQAFVKLRQMGLAATEDRLRSFGNTASASGKSLNQMIEAVADAGTGEFERLKEFGIKTKKEGDNVKFTMAGVTTTVANNSVAITKYLEGIGNTKFGGAMAKQMDTLNGAFSNVQDSLRGMLSAIGEGALGTAVKNIAKSLANGISYITPFMASIGNLFGGVVLGIGSILDGLGQLWAGFGGAKQVNDDLSILTVTFNLIGQGAQVLGSAIGAVFGFIGNLVASVAEMWGSSFGYLLGDLTAGFNEGGRSWSNSIVGILRAVKYVVGEMPKLFKVAVSDIMRMFRDMGAGIMAFLSGDWKKGTELFKKPQMVRTAQTAGNVGRGAYDTYRDVKGADAAINRLMGRTVKPKLNSGADSRPDKPGGDKDKDKDKANEAERRAKAEAEFWKTLQGEVDTAKMLPLAAEDYRKQLELQKILGRDLIAGEKTRVANLMQEARTAKFITDAAVAHTKAERDSANDNELFAKRLAGMTNDQLGVEGKILDFRNAALDRGVNLLDAQYLVAEKLLRADEQSAVAIKKKNEALATAVGLAGDYSATFKKAQTAKTNTDNMTALDTAYNGGTNGLGITKEVYDEIKAGIQRASKDAALTMRQDFGARITELGEQISGKWGNAIGKIGKLIEGMAAAAKGDFGGLGAIGGILDVIGKKQDGSLNGVGKAASDAASNTLDKLFSKGTITDPLKSLSSGFGDFKSDLGNLFGKGGSFTKGLGSVLGKAGMGAQIGEITSSLAGAIGLKLNKTGSQVGGAIGGAVLGPLGAIGGSVLGGLVGNVLSKPKYGTAVLNGSVDPVVSGRGSAQKKAATGLAGSVQEGLSNLATELGGQLGKYAVSIGLYKDKYRVSTTGYGGKLGGQGGKTSSLGIVDFGKEGEADAIKFAIEDAIKDGAITGLAPIIQKALSGLGAEAAVQFAKDWTSAMADYKSLIDPMGAAVDAIVNPLKALKNTILQVGASSEDLAKFEDYRKRKLDEVLKDQTSSFRDILDQLNGSGGGATALSMLTKQLADLDKFKSDIVSGKTVNQDDYSALVGKILGNAGEIYGANTSDFQNIITSLKESTTGALSNQVSAFDMAAGNTTVLNTDSTTSAVNAGTDAITSALSVQTDYLGQIASSLKNANFGSSSAYKAGSVNGSLVAAY